MNGRRNNRARNSELPIPAREPDAPSTEGRIELAPPPDIDIAQDHLGILFTERRRALGMKVEEIAEEIKVKADYLRAIEQEKFDLLPTPEYARLFIKAYAERLGFNLAEVFALLDISAGLAPPVVKPKIVAPTTDTVRRPSTPSEPTTNAASPNRRSLLIWGTIGVLVVVLVVVGWIVTHRAKPNSQAASSPTKAATAPATATHNEPAAPPQEDSLPLPGGTVSAEPMNLSLQFTRDVWVLLEADHDTVASRIVKAGERIDASAVESFVLSSGHTTGITAALNGVTLSPFSTWTTRLDHYLITQDSLRAWMGNTTTGSGEPASRRGTIDTGGAGR
jgi:cytoskeleton protein RodZ